VLCGRSPLCGPPQTVSSPSCVPFSLREQLMVITLLCEHTCHIYRISNTSQFSYQRLTRIVLVTTDPIIAVPLRCLSDGIFPARKPDLHHPPLLQPTVKTGVHIDLNQVLLSFHRSLHISSLSRIDPPLPFPYSHANKGKDSHDS